VKKIYLDMTQITDCISIFVKDAEVLQAGTTVYLMSEKDKNEEYQKFADNYDIHFLFDGDRVEVDFYTVPRVDIMAVDSEGGYIGTVGEMCDIDGNKPICYISKTRQIFWIADNFREFLKRADCWKEQLKPYDQVEIFRSRKDAQKKYEFIKEGNMKLSIKEKISYGLGAVGKDMVYMLSASYILYYYQDVLGVSAIAMGIILMAARVFDAFNDPIMGVIVAKTRTKWGKFRPWLLIGTITNAVVLYAMFAAPPALDGPGLIAYAAVTYVLWGVTYTMMDIPFWSMIPAFTEGGREREGLTTLARSCAGVGSAIVTIITMKCVYALGQGDERTGFRWFALIIAVLFVIFTAFVCMTIKEKSTVDVDSPSVKQMFRALIQNDQAMTVVAAIVLINCALYITSNLLIYFFKYDFGGETWYNSYTLFNIFGGAVQILSMMLFFPLLRKFMSAIQIFYVSIIMAVAGYGVLLILAFTNISSIFLLFIPGFLVFAAFGMLTVLTTVFLANTVDYGELKNNRRDESVIFSMQTFVVKLASGLAALIASVCLTVFHFSDDTTQTAVSASPASSVAGLRMTMAVLPMIGLLIAVFVFYKNYRLSEQKLEEIAGDLKKRVKK